MRKIQRSATKVIIIGRLQRGVFMNVQRMKMELKEFADLFNSVLQDYNDIIPLRWRSFLQGFVCCPF
jgi:hypothetical protein